MSHFSSTHIARDKSIYGEAIYWFSMTALAAAASIVLHELAHFMTASLFGASGVVFHWAYVDHDPSSVSNVGNAAIALLGPLASCSMVAIAWWRSRKILSAPLLALGFSAALRNLAVLPFTIRTLLGRDTSTFFFDEIRGATALAISPLLPVIFSLVIGFLGVIYFCHRTKHQKGIAFVAIMISGAIAGVYAWSAFGPLLLPGGHGLN